MLGRSHREFLTQILNAVDQHLCAKALPHFPRFFFRLFFRLFHGSHVITAFPRRNQWQKKLFGSELWTELFREGLRGDLPCAVVEWYHHILS